MGHLFTRLTLVVAAIALSGCASTITKNAVREVDAADIAYGRVFKVSDADTSENRAVCTKYQNHPPSVSVCQHLHDYDVAIAYVMHLGRFIQYGVPVPKADYVKKGYFVEFSPSSHLASYRRIAAREDMDTCKWVGVSPDFLNGRAGILTGFVAGMLIIPGAVMLASDWQDGGVECEGWSYKVFAERAKAAVPK
ncbi:MAG TPA: hypothetical protein VEC35_17155 [Noviherbaspirillum sp.]|nr:hypothetical protein [Noviherbaspirillum sp.]